MMQKEKIKTGIPGLDEMLHGGLIPQRPYIVSGQLGSGKTTLAMQFLLEGAKNGENVLYITTEEPPNEIKRNFENFNWDLSKVKVFDAIPDVMTYEITPIKDITALREIVSFKDVPYTIRKTPEHGAPEMTFNALQNALRLALSTSDYSRIVVDSLTALKFFCIPSYDHNLGVQSFIRFLSELKITALLTVEMPFEYQFEPELFLARGEIRLLKWRDKNGELKRGIMIEKYKGSSHDIHIRPMEITPDGIVVHAELHVEKSPLEAYLEVLPVEAVEAGENAGEDMQAEITEEPAVGTEKQTGTAKVHGKASESESTAIAVETATQVAGKQDVAAPAPPPQEKTVVEGIDRATFEEITKEIKSLQDDTMDADLIGVDVHEVTKMIGDAMNFMSLGKFNEVKNLIGKARKLLDECIEAFHTGEKVEKVTAEIATASQSGEKKIEGEVKQAVNVEPPATTAETPQPEKKTKRKKKEKEVRKEEKPETKKKGAKKGTKKTTKRSE